MTDRQLFDGCVEPQALAAYIDGRLEGDERAAVEAHLAGCEGCYEVFAESVQIGADLDADARVQAESRRSRTWWVASGLVAASLATIVWQDPAWLRRRSAVDQAMHEFIGAVGTDRFAAARLSDDFAWAPPPTSMRGSGNGALAIPAQQAGLKLRALAESQRTAATLRGAGVALLAEGRIDDAVAALEESVRLQPETSFARIDLSAALLERWRRTNDAGDAVRALDEAARARQLANAPHAALFNHALALEAMGMANEARKAWRAYLEVDAASKWADEARQRLEALPGTSSMGRSAPSLTTATLTQLARADPLPVYRRLEREALRSWADAVLSDRPADLTEAAALAAALDSTDRDRYFVDLTRVASALAPGDRRARRCLASAVDGLNRWWTAYDEGAYGPARQHALGAREQLQCAGAPTAEADVRAAIIDVASGRSADGLARLAAVEAAATERHYPRTLAIVHQLRGLTALQHGSLDAAVDAYRLAARFADRAGDGELAALSLAYVVTAHAARGDRESAWRDAVACARQLPAIESARRRFQFFSRTALLAQESGLFGAAATIGDALLADPGEQRLPWTQVAAHLIRARAAASIGRPDAAARSVDTARQLAAGMGHADHRDEALAEVAMTTGQIFATSDGRRAVSALTEALTFQKVRANQFRMASLLLDRGRAHAQTGNLRRAEEDWSAGVALLEDTRTSIRDAQLRIARTAAAWELFEELVNVQRDRPDLALQTVERTHARELLDSIAPDTDLQAFQRSSSFAWLPATTAALVYASLPQRLLIWYVTAGTTTLSEQPLTAAALRDLVAASARAVQAGGEPEPALAAALLPEGVDPGRLQNLIVVPDGVLHQVPFGLLRLSPAQARLLDTTVVSVSPSLSILKVLVGRPAFSRAAAPLLVGASLGGTSDGLMPLPDVVEEIRGLQRLYPGAKVLAGADARADTVLRDLADADLLHFAGHAISDPVHPSRSRLLLAPGAAASALRPSEIAAARMRQGGVVVLGACETAAGSTFSGEGPLNLARPFLIAGASTVIATLWPVADRDASRLLRDLHALLARGVPPGLALATVQRREQGVSRVNSAAFVLIGRA